MFPQLIFVIKDFFTLEAKVVVRALFVVRMEARFGLEDLNITRRQVNLDKIDSEEY